MNKINRKEFLVCLKDEPIFKQFEFFAVRAVLKNEHIYNGFTVNYGFTLLSNKCAIRECKVIFHRSQQQ